MFDIVRRSLYPKKDYLVCGIYDNKREIMEVHLVDRGGSLLPCIHSEKVDVKYHDVIASQSRYDRSVFEKHCENSKHTLFSYSKYL